MKIAAIRKINEKMPYWMKRPFAGLIRGKLINNQAFLAQYRELEAADVMGGEEIERLQLEKLRQTLIHAYEHTAYYKELFDKQHFDPSAVSSVEELAKLPILTKAALKEHYTQLQADDIDDFYEVSTGGTTGAPTHVLMERVAIYREYAFTYHFWSKFGYDYKSSKLATFRGVDLHNKLSEINPLYQEIRMNVFLMNRNNIKEYVKRIDGYGADFAYGYPSAVYNFCRLAREAGIVLAGKFKAALLISENLYEFQEEVISEVLSCPIAMFYGHSERAVYAEKYGEGYAFDPLYGVTEIDKDNMPIVTGFINRKTPLIRYKVDDEVRLLDDGAFEVTGHRDSEVVYGANGRQFRATMLDFHGMISKKLSGFQFVQEVPGELTLKVLKENDCPDEIEEIRAECERKLGEGAVVRVEMVDSLNSYRGGGTSTGCSFRKYRLLDQRYCPDSLKNT